MYICRSPNSLIDLDRYSDSVDDVERSFLTVPRSSSCTYGAVRSKACVIYSFQAQNSRLFVVQCIVFTTGPSKRRLGWRILRHRKCWGGVERCHHEVRFETRRCSAPDPAGDRAYIALPDPLAGFRVRGMGKGEWKGLGMEREWKGKERKGSI